mmetsp:Transcript_55622/g.143286  ORF Transcript_55622/g.143286 Transcript_55622/m.143286 type:complete len:243 (-) Transcript_55622:52-780(-)
MAQRSEAPRQLPLLASLARKRASDGGVASKAHDNAEAPAKKDLGARVKKPVAKERKKAKKGAPAEVSSRRPVAPQQKVEKKAPQARDPRFDDFSGKLDVDMFEKSYGFLEEYRQDELKLMKKEVRRLQKQQRKRKSAALAEKAEHINLEVRRRVQQDKQRRHMGEMRDTERGLRADERQKVQETGKVPYFHGRSAVRRMVQQQRKADKKGGRDKLEERREKKRAGKEKRKLPARRNRDAEGS